MQTVVGLLHHSLLSYIIGIAKYESDKSQPEIFCNQPDKFFFQANRNLLYNKKEKMAFSKISSDILLCTEKILYSTLSSVLR